MTECKNLDPTALGLFLVAIVSFGIALSNLLTVDGATGITDSTFMVLGVMILFVAYFAYKAESQFGFTVFALVGAGVFLSATSIGMGTWECIFFGITFILAILWSVFAKTPKNLTLILITTALIFLIVGISGIVDGDLSTVLGIVALLNGIFAVYLAFALATEKAPVF